MCMSRLNEDSRYHIPKEPTQPVEDRIRQATQKELEKWSNDQDCFEMELCAKERARRHQPTERLPPPPDPFPGYQDALKSSGGQEPPTQPAKADEWHRPYSQQDTFNPRTEVSADARYIASRIVKHLWIIFVLLPFVAALLLIVAGVIK